jgi:hypothetical protein
MSVVLIFGIHANISVPQSLTWRLLENKIIPRSLYGNRSSGRAHKSCFPTAQTYRPKSVVLYLDARFSSLVNVLGRRIESELFYCLQF